MCLSCFIILDCCLILSRYVCDVYLHRVLTYVAIIFNRAIVVLYGELVCDRQEPH